MSDKLIRDELLRSHRYVSLSNDTTKLLFLHLTLSSDSLSNAEATTTALSIVMGRHVTEHAAAVLLAELADHDLVRVYESHGKRYVHIPRSRQRIRYLSGKHPRPPVGIEDIEIKELIAKVGLKSDRGQTQVGPFTPEVEVLLPLPLLLKNRTPSRASTNNVAAHGFAQFWSAYPKKKSKGTAEKAWAKLKPDEAKLSAILKAIEQAKASDAWTKDSGRYVPHPASWLNAKGWEDEQPNPQFWGEEV